MLSSYSHKIVLHVISDDRKMAIIINLRLKYINNVILISITGCWGKFDHIVVLRKIQCHICRWKPPNFCSGSISKCCCSDVSSKGLIRQNCKWSKLPSEPKIGCVPHNQKVAFIFYSGHQLLLVGLNKTCIFMASTEQSNAYRQINKYFSMRD